MEINYTKKVPAKIQKRVLENLEVYHLSLGDAFEEAVRELAKKGTELYNAWYYSDYRAFLPQIYEERYLDLEKYPLKYADAMECKISAETLKNELANINITPSFASSYITGIKDAVQTIDSITDSNGEISVKELADELLILKQKPSLYGDYGSALKKNKEIAENIVKRG